MSSITAHIQFMKTREENDTKVAVLSGNLVQSFILLKFNFIKDYLLFF